MSERPADRDSAPLVGRNPVLELLRADSRRVEEVAVLGEGRGPALQELLTLARQTTAGGLAELAATAGYADQPHLTREVRAIADTTPAALRDAA